MMQTSVEPKYNIFVSYRSKNIHIVRPIAEQLMAAGLKVWFAEYEILLSGRQRFKEAINHGINNCSFGICFTNDRYAQSEHCQKESNNMRMPRGSHDDRKSIPGHSDRSFSDLIQP